MRYEKKIDERTFYTTVDLFNDIWEKTKETVPELCKDIDYALAASRPVDLYYDQFDPMFVLNRSGSEGYYLDLFIKGILSEDRKIRTAELGTIKTLIEDEEGCRMMAKLYGECLIAYEKVMRKADDIICRDGYNIRFYKDCGQGFGFCEARKEKVSEILQKYLLKPECIDPTKYDHAIVRDNLSRNYFRCVLKNDGIFKTSKDSDINAAFSEIEPMLEGRSMSASYYLDDRYCLCAGYFDPIHKLNIGISLEYSNGEIEREVYPPVPAGNTEENVRKVLKMIFDEFYQV